MTRPPLLLRPRPVARPWGGSRIAPRFGWPATGPCGEWWLLSTHAGEVSELADGGARLTDWLAGEGAGRGLPGPDDFPVLLKFLDCQELLSLQVHPDDETARAFGLPRGKTEAWHVLEADAGAGVYHGLAEGVTSTELLDAVDAGAPDAEIQALLRFVPVASGDTFLVEAGTIHAVGPGVVIFEVQQTSDTTYRIHDWERGRPTQLAEARRAARDREPAPVVAPTIPVDAWAVLADVPAFRLRRGRVAHGLAAPTAGPFLALTALSGIGEVEADGGRVALAPGDTVLTAGEAVLRGAGLDVLAVDVAAAAG